MALTFDCVSVADGREPSGFAAITGDSPDGLRRRVKVDNLSYFEPFCRSSWPRGKAIEGDTPLFHSSCRMAEAKLTTKAVKSWPARVDTAREATLSVLAQQYRD